MVCCASLRPLQFNSVLMRPNPKQISRLRKVRLLLRLGHRHWHAGSAGSMHRSGNAPAPLSVSLYARPHTQPTQHPCTPPLPQVMESAFSGVGSHHFSTEGAGGDDMFPYVSFTLNIEG